VTHALKEDAMAEPIETYSTIQRTSKQYKIASLLALICLVGFAYNIFSANGNGETAGMFLLGAIGLFIFSKIGRWWTNR
jgi:hypothetical protein